MKKPGPAAGAAGDYDAVIDQALRWAESHELIGESLPWLPVEFVERIRERCGDDLFIGSLTTPATLDALASFRGTEGLLLDIVDSPDKVHRALTRVQTAHSEIIAALEELLEYNRSGSVNRHGFWSSGRCNVVNCDFSCMISPEMFRESVFPYQVQALEDMDAADYHLDGPDAIRHLETICRHGEKLKTIQWVCGAGNQRRQPGLHYLRICGRLSPVLN